MLKRFSIYLLFVLLALFISFASFSHAKTFKWNDITKPLNVDFIRISFGTIVIVEIYLPDFIENYKELPLIINAEGGGAYTGVLTHKFLTVNDKVDYRFAVQFDTKVIRRVNIETKFLKKGLNIFKFTGSGTSNESGYSIQQLSFETAALENFQTYMAKSSKPIQSAKEEKNQYVKEAQKYNPPVKKDDLISVRWALVIGISNYRDSRIPSLRYASSDANAFYDWLISPSGGRYAPSRVRLLLNEEATGRSIKMALYEWLGETIEEDIVTIFFAGHGSPQSPDKLENLYLLPYDTQYDSVATTGFPMWDIETALKRFIRAKKVIVMADACHAGGIGQSFDVARRANRGMNAIPISSNLQNLSEIGDGICIISASDDNQYSQESNKWGGGHGVFTYYLLQGLKGKADYSKDNRVSLGEIIPYLSEQVRRATRNAQTPTVAGRFDPALSIGK